MLDFVLSTIFRIRDWWIRGDSRLYKFIKNFIISLGIAWAASLFVLSMLELVLGFILVFKLRTTEWVGNMSDQAFVVGFWVFVVVLGLGVYLGIRALLIDVIAKTQDGYRDTFGSTVSTKRKINKLEDDLGKVKKEIKAIKKTLGKRK
jgi:hypothetical protein